MTTITVEAATPAEMLAVTRRAAGLTTREIAAKVGVSQGTVSNWENGRGEPTITQFVLWARATRQPAEQLLSGLSIQDVRPKGLEPLTF